MASTASLISLEKMARLPVVPTPDAMSGFMRSRPLRMVMRSASSVLYTALAFAIFVFSVSTAQAQESAVDLDPAQTTIEFTLDTTLHAVHGTFKLKSGHISFDPATGKASGAIVVDATSGDSDNESRDKKMHQQILESQKYPEIVFTPQHVKGSVNPQGTSQVEVSGVFRIHGQDHDITMTFTVQPPAGGKIQASTHFSVPYVQWGIKGASTFLLHASDIVEVEVHASGQPIPKEPRH
ncbi:MAG TPA: YceI family protein [Candidatus Sulfotelmatobacter sp.]|jgi:polyisoprenoid-binding protein YceI|nr:YceI family protein [Candidatus Sulfotelmatobacter sp.]